MDLQQACSALRDEHARRPFADLPDAPGYWYAVWLDPPGAQELTRVAPEPVTAGIVYAGECVTQSLRRHLAHRDIGSLTLMKNLAALLRQDWRLTATRGTTLHEPGRTRLRRWMLEHLTATATPAPAGVPVKKLLAEVDPPLRLVGWQPDATDLRLHIKQQRAELDAGR